MLKNKNNSTNNIMTVNGRITSDLQYDHESHGIPIFSTFIEIYRRSGNIDILPVRIPEYVLNGQYIHEDTCVDIVGELRTYNEKNSFKSKLILYILVKEIKVVNISSGYKNEILLNGFVCRPPVIEKRLSEGESLI